MACCSDLHRRLAIRNVRNHSGNGYRKPYTCIAGNCNHRCSDQSFIRQKTIRLKLLAKIKTAED